MKDNVLSLHNCNPLEPRSPLIYYKNYASETEAPTTKGFGTIFVFQLLDFQLFNIQLLNFK